MSWDGQKEPFHHGLLVKPLNHSKPSLDSLEMNPYEFFNPKCQGTPFENPMKSPKLIKSPSKSKVKISIESLTSEVPRTLNPRGFVGGFCYVLVVLPEIGGRPVPGSPGVSKIGNLKTRLMGQSLDFQPKKNR